LYILPLLETAIFSDETIKPCKIPLTRLYCISIYTFTQFIVLIFEHKKASLET